MAEVNNDARVKLSQNEALMIEALRALGWSDDELISRVRSGDLPIDESIFHFEYKGLTEFDAQQPELFESAVREGYQIKYNTLGGIRSWFLIVLGREAEISREPGVESVTIELTAAEKERFASVLSFGWKITGEGSADEPAVYKIEPAQRF